MRRSFFEVVSNHVKKCKAANFLGRRVFARHPMSDRNTDIQPEDVVGVLETLFSKFGLQACFTFVSRPVTTYSSVRTRECRPAQNTLHGHVLITSPNSAFRVVSREERECKTRNNVNLEALQNAHKDRRSA